MMTKKLTKHGNSLAIVIDRPILKLLKIDEDTEVVMRIENGELVIGKQSDYPDERTHVPEMSDESVEEIARRILVKYRPLFEKLAKE